MFHPAPDPELTLDVMQVGHARVFALGDVAGPAAVQGPEASGANFPATAQVMWAKCGFISCALLGACHDGQGVVLYGMEALF